MNLRSTEPSRVTMSSTASEGTGEGSQGRSHGVRNASALVAEAVPLHIADLPKLVGRQLLDTDLGAVGFA
jgi:hypothetical protein